MNNLTYDELDNMFKGGENLTDKPIFIDFYATWWGPCKVFEQVLNEVSPEYEDKIQMYKVNIEEEPELAKRFKVMSVPLTTSISKSGDVNSTLGSIPKDTLKYFLDGLISKK